MDIVRCPREMLENLYLADQALLSGWRVRHLQTLDGVDFPGGSVLGLDNLGCRPFSGHPLNLELSPHMPPVGR